MYSILPSAHKGNILVLTTLLAFQSAGWLLAWRMAQSNAQEQARLDMRKDETEVESRTLHSADLAALRVEEKEIWLDGNLYDIRTETRCGDSVILELYHDEWEESLLKGLGEGLARAAPGERQKAPSMSWLAKWLAQIYLPPPSPAMPEAQATGTQTSAFPYLLLRLQAIPDLYGLPPEKSLPKC